MKACKKKRIISIRPSFPSGLEGQNSWQSLSQKLGPMSNTWDCQADPAHQQHRRAEAHLINNRYDEAMQCHHSAAELLLDAMKSTTSSVALESITLQHSYHLKQKDLIKSKKDQYARVKKAMDNIKYLGKDPFLNLEGHEYAKLQVAIFRAINETDSLLHFLSSTNDSLLEHKLVRDSILPTCDVTDGFKTEKTQQTVIEELRILSQNLHSLVEQLVLQVEVLKDENVTLKERVNYLEKERVKYLNLPSNDFQNFSTLSMGSESLPKESAQRVPILPIATTAADTDPNFDLTALRE